MGVMGVMGVMGGMGRNELLNFEETEVQSLA
jgi:hypothetical protein